MEPSLPPGASMVDAYLAEIQDRCARHSGEILVAECDGLVVGMVSVYAAVPFTDIDDPRGTYALVGDLVVRVDARRAGIGKLLLAAAENHARAHGASELRVEMLSANGAAVRLYREAGFTSYLITQRKVLGAIRTTAVPEAGVGGTRPE